MLYDKCLLTSDVNHPECRCTEGRHLESSRVEVSTSARITAKELKILAVKYQTDLGIQAQEGKVKTGVLIGVLGFIWVSWK